MPKTYSLSHQLTA